MHLQLSFDFLQGYTGVPKSARLVSGRYLSPKRPVGLSSRPGSVGIARGSNQNFDMRPYDPGTSDGGDTAALGASSYVQSQVQPLGLWDGDL